MSRPDWRRQGALVLPLLLVNGMAVVGQAGWGYDHLGNHWTVAVLFAAAVESIGIYLAVEAHAALMAGDASARLRLGSYLVGGLVGVLNYAHFAGPHYRPTPLALTLGLLSSASPWLWAIRSRSMNRDRLRELGQVDPRAVRFSLLRWSLFPVRTFRAFRGAVWAGIVQPAEAVAAADARRRRIPAETAQTIPAPPAETDGYDVEPFMLAALSDPVPAIEAGMPEPVSETVPAPTRTARRRVWSDQQILAALANFPDVPVRADGTVGVGYVRETFNCRQDRAIRLLQEAGMHRPGDPPAVPAKTNGAVPDIEGVTV